MRILLFLPCYLVTNLVLPNGRISINALLPSVKNLHRPDTSLVVETKPEERREREMGRKRCADREKVKIGIGSIRAK